MVFKELLGRLLSGELWQNKWVIEPVYYGQLYCTNNGQCVEND